MKFQNNKLVEATYRNNQILFISCLSYQSRTYHEIAN